MKIIVPMAGMGKRLRPHTLTTAKPLLPVAGKSIVQRLVEDIVAVSDQKVDEIAFVVGHFGSEVEKNLVQIAEKLGARGSIHYQDEALGTAHAILCAKSALSGPVTVAFADTLFRADFKLNTTGDGVLWVQRIEDPRQFGVVLVNKEGVITEFREKPEEFISDLAMIGIYYFNNGENLKTELQYLIDNDIRNGGEYQLPDALRNMVKKGARFFPGAVTDWMDCGNKDAMVNTNHKILTFTASENLIAESLKNENSKIISPCYIGQNVVLKNSTVGPYASIGEGSLIADTQLSDSIVMQESQIKNSSIRLSVIGKNTRVKGFSGQLSLGDYSVIES
ncbi:MAG: nucleotidyltransferase [Crocinitomicaceae bacterium]|nr:nucleotidyltransferase [Crocinitomicaceae bacterium]